MRPAVLVLLLVSCCVYLGVESCSGGAAKSGARVAPKIPQAARSLGSIITCLTPLIDRLRQWINSSPMTEENVLRNRLATLAQRFSGVRHPGRLQFGFMVATTEYGIPLEVLNRNGPSLDFSSRIYPPSRPSYTSFVAAANYKLPNETYFRHVERRLLTEEYEHLRQRYHEVNGNDPTVLILYTYYFPCDNCTTTIINFARESGLQVHVAFTANYSKGGDAARNEKRLDEKGIKVMYMPLSDPDSQVKRKREATCGDPWLQRCLVHTLSADRSCCFSSDSDIAEFINTFVAECYPDFTQDCLHEHTAHCTCEPNFSQFEVKMDEKYASCLLGQISQPLNIPNPSAPRDLMWCPNCLQTPPASRSLKQPTACRRKGDECMTTGGNSLCRSNHYCGLHGYNYNWCYTDDNDNWEYCCRTSCKKRGSSYMWCEAGKRALIKKYPYCGDSGRKSIKGTRCADDHPCGNHGYHYHWCYLGDGAGRRTDKWEYCCRPDHKCANYDENYKWCYVGRYYLYKKCVA